MKTRLFFPTIAASLLCLVAGCSQQTMDSAAKDAKNDASIAQREANRAERKVRPVVTEAKRQVAPDLKKLDLGARATAALRLNRSLPDTIRVDASETGIQLRGTVSSEADKALAGRVAGDTLPAGATLKNELTVSK